jgi:hypothetical protein
MLTIENIKDTLSAMGFSPVDGENSKWGKIYSKCSHKITISFGSNPNATQVDYGHAIMANADRTTTQNFSQPESLVVFECVNRLLDLGIYRPRKKVPSR